MMSTRVSTKRLSPFGAERQPVQKQIKYDHEIIYQNTMNILMGDNIQSCAYGSGEDAQNSMLLPYVSEVKAMEIFNEALVNAPLTRESETSSCFSCSEQNTETVPCSFCMKSICMHCIRQCEKCSEIFCSICSTFNYDDHRDRTFCLGCNADEIKWKTSAVHDHDNDLFQSSSSSPSSSSRF